MYSRPANALASKFMARPQTHESSNAALRRTLLEQARQAALHSYSPYSGFRVGAALRLTNGEIVTGTNVENVSYGLTICAERSALVARRLAIRPRDPHRSRRRRQPERMQPARPAAPAARCWPSSSFPDAPVVFPAADGLRTMPFSDLLPSGLRDEIEMTRKLHDHAIRSQDRSAPHHRPDPQEARRLAPSTPAKSASSSPAQPTRLHPPGTAFRLAHGRLPARPLARRNPRPHPRHARLRRKVRSLAALARPPSTSTPPAASATRPASSSLPSPRPAAWPSP